MPRDGSNVYHYPTGIEGNPDEIIESAGYNSFLADVEQDANLPRPILSGGTGAVNADDALANLGAEKAGQIVTNYDSDVFVAGSFYSAGSATGSPVAGHAFAGIVYVADSNNLVIEARDLDDTAVPPQMYIRQKKASVWGTWAPDFNQSAQDAHNNNLYVNSSGDTMTGSLVLPATAPTLTTHATNKAYVDAGDAASVASATAADAAFVRLAGNQTLTGGFSFTSVNLGNLSPGYTVGPMLGNYQFGLNNGALTIFAPSVDCAVDLLVTNTTAGAITFSGFTVNAANTGDSLTTTNGHRFLISIRRIGNISTYVIKALQ